MTDFDQLVRQGHRRVLLRRDPHHCVWCARTVTRKAATLDHLMPRGRGGPNITANLVLACFRCNNMRGNLGATRWACRCVAAGWQPDLDLLLNRIESALADVAGVPDYEGFVRHLRDKRRGLIGLQQRLVWSRRADLERFLTQAGAL